MIKLIILWFVVVLIAKVLRDAAKFCWEITWLKQVKLLDLLRGAKPPFDLFHLADGLIITGSFAVALGIVFYYEGGLSFVFKDLIFLAVAVAAFWVVFYGLFKLLYDVLIRRSV